MNPVFHCHLDCSVPPISMHLNATSYQVSKCSEPFVLFFMLFGTHLKSFNLLSFIFPPFISQMMPLNQLILEILFFSYSHFSCCTDNHLFEWLCIELSHRCLRNRDGTTVHSLSLILLCRLAIGWAEECRQEEGNIVQMKTCRLCTLNTPIYRGEVRRG